MKPDTMSAPATPPEPPPEEPGSDAALDQLLRQIITGFFVLTDGQGALSKWSDPAELLFGLETDDALGQMFFGRIVGPPLPAEGEGWRRFLESGEPPMVRARTELQAQHAKVGTFPLEAVFVPVKLDEGFDFSLFLEDLSFELPVDLMVLRMRQQHPVVIRALRAALSEHAQPWEGWRTAGTMIVFRPLVETPWLEEALRERERAAAAAEEEVLSRIQAYEMPDVQGDDVYDLEDARAVVDRLKWATERIEELEGQAQQMESAARQAAEANQRAEAVEIVAAELSQIVQRPDFGQSAEQEAERLELKARVERLERTIAEAVEQAAASRLAAEQERAAAAAAERAREHLEQRLAAVEKTHTPEGRLATISEEELAKLREELANVREEALEASSLAHMASAVRHDVEVLKLQGDEAIALREEISRLRDRAERVETDLAAREERDRALQRDAEAARTELRAALERVEALSEQAARLRAAVDAVPAERGTAELTAQDRLRIDEAQRAAAEARAGLEAMRSANQQLLAQSAELRDEAGNLKAQLAELRDGDGHARRDLGGLARQQEEVRAWLEEARRERDEARAQVLEAVARVEEARVALETGAARPPSQPSAVTSESGVHRDLKRARDDVDQVRRDSEAVRARLDKLAAEAEAAVSRAEEARADAVALRAENAETREEARAAQATAREAAARIDAMDRGAATVLAEVRAQKSLVEEIGELARAAKEDAAASRVESAVARAATSRVEDLVGHTREQVEEALGIVAATREQAAAAAEAATITRDLAAASSEQAVETIAKMGEELEERLRSELSAEEAALRLSVETLANRTAALEARPVPEEAPPGVEPEIVEAISARIESMAAELASTAQRVEEFPDPSEQVGEQRVAELSAELMAARTETEQARQAIEDLREELRSLREYSAASRMEATAALETASSARAAGTVGERSIEALRKEVAAVHAMVQEFRDGFEESRQAAIAARRDAEQARAVAENVGTQNQATTERFTEVWRDILNLGPNVAVSAGEGQPVRRGAKKARHEPEVAREPRPGFDDSPQPMAVLTLDGRFVQLNPPFSRIVGYREHEFLKAVWPSVHDRRSYKEQYAQLERLAAGDLERVRVQSTYMHGQGLMVPIVGELTVVRDEAGNPDHLLLVAEDRQTS